MALNSMKLSYPGSSAYSVSMVTVTLTHWKTWFLGMTRRSDCAKKSEVVKWNGDQQEKLGTEIGMVLIQVHTLSCVQNEQTECELLSYGASTAKGHQCQDAVEK